MNISARSITARLVAVGAVSITAWGCNRGAPAAGDTASAGGSIATAADTLPMVRGTVASVSSGDLVVKADTGTVSLKVAAPLKVYERVPAKLSDVTPNSFIGVTTVKQPDGTERATEIHIFPEELRGLGEGSRMMTPNAGAGGAGNGMTNGAMANQRMTNGAMSGQRMTNGAMSGQRMTNGSATASRMSNGSVSAANGSSFVVQYAGGSLKVTVPSDVRVTRLQPTSKPLAAGARVVVVAKKNPDGSLTAREAMLSK